MKVRNIKKRRLCLETRAGQIPLLLKLSSVRRTISISIDSKAQVSVSAPAHVAEKVIVSFVQQKAFWIQDKLSKARHKKSLLHSKKYAEGEEFLFLGDKYQFRIIEKNIKRAKITFDGRGWLAEIPFDLSEAERYNILDKKMKEWYRAQAKEVIGGRIFHYSRIIGNEPIKIQVRTQKRIWGNCDPHSKIININWQVILAPMDVIDYIVVHELCHLLVPNHSQRFWKKVETILPYYQQQKKWLKIHFLEMLLPGQD